MKELVDLLKLYKEIGVEYVRKLNVASRVDMLDSLKEQVEHCTLCELYRERKNAVFGEGNDNAEIMFVGEAPGRDEDIQGRPFVGRAGKLLTELLEEIGLKREDVYIANCLKCRPPNNRDPKPDELTACFPYLKKQIEIIKPKVIGTLGRYSTYVLTLQKGALGTLRGRIFDYHGIKVLPMYHPAYLLRNPNAIEVFVNDLKRLKEMAYG